jgi:hypothetical protein
MSRAQIVLDGRDARQRAAAWINKAPTGTRIEFKAARRNIAQNDRMWAMLTDIARQHAINGRKYTADNWKVMFLTAYAEQVGQQIRHLPAIHRAGMVPCGRSSSDLSVKEMSELIELMFAWGAENDIVWSDPKREGESGKGESHKGESNGLDKIGA